MDTTFAIVGTAGRRDDANRLSANHFQAMCECSRLLIKQFQESGYSVDTVVSGGAAWADHVAVKLFLGKEIPKLKLFFPCVFDMEMEMYTTSTISSKDNPNNRWSPGEIANNLHNRFSRKVGFNSLGEIFFAIKQGAETCVCKGFHARDAMVAQSDAILAMTFGDREWLKEGGTAHTMMTYLNRVKKYGFFDKSFHYDLNSGDIFCGAKVHTEDISKQVTG